MNSNVLVRYGTVSEVARFSRATDAALERGRRKTHSVLRSSAGALPSRRLLSILTLNSSGWSFRL